MNINVDIKNTIKWCATCLELQQAQPHKKTMSYEIPRKHREVVGADIFFVKNTTLCALYVTKVSFILVKKADTFAANVFIKAAKIVFAEYGLPKKLYQMEA